MRLIIWKVSKPSAEIYEIDKDIVQALRLRLTENWQSYMRELNTADLQKTLRPSVAPCMHAPGRQLVILRDDVQAAASGMFLSFDGILSSSYDLGSPTSNGKSSKGINSRATSSEDSPEGSTSRKKWGSWRNLWASTNGNSETSRPTSARSNASSRQTGKSTGGSRTNNKNHRTD